MSSKLCPFCMRMAETDTCPHCGKNINYTGQPMHLPAGYVVSGKHPYVLGAALGQGGFGITYIALDMVTNERVAIKEYYPTYCSARTNNSTVTAYSNQEEVYLKGKEHFLDEARTLKSLSDLKNIVNVLDFFEFNNTAYLVMEYLEGSSLKEYAAKNGKFPAQEFFAQIRPLMEDIERMHQRGVVHRDIAPDNIMLLPDGQMKLIDFGTARSFVGDRSMTVVVKKGFAPVEQYLTKGTTPSTDVYALAATIYYCITGTVPMDSAERQYDDTPLESPAALGADITPLQEKALAKALEIQQKARTQSVQEFLDDLNKKREKSKPEPVKPESPITKPDSSEQKPLHQKKKTVWIVAAAILAVVVLAGIFVFAPGAKKNIWEKNVLMESPHTKYDNIAKESITSVTFLDTLANAPGASWDVSEGQDKSVLAWAEKNGESYNLYIAGDGGINAGNACRKLFAGYPNLKEINFNDCFHTEEATNMSFMFSGCCNLTELNVSGFDTSNVTDMSDMFSSCGKLQPLNLGNWDTSNVTDMNCMFSDCNSLTSLNLSNWDTSMVTDMHDMFYNCNSLTSLDLSRWDTSKVTDMSSMFSSCQKLKSLDLSGFNTSNVTKMNRMFYSCLNLTTLNFGNWDTSRVESYYQFMDSGKKVNGRPWEELFEK